MTRKRRGKRSASSLPREAPDRANQVVASADSLIQSLGHLDLKEDEGCVGASVSGGSVGNEVPLRGDTVVIGTGRGRSGQIRDEGVPSRNRRVEANRISLDRTNGYHSQTIHNQVYVPPQRRTRRTDQSHQQSPYSTTNSLPCGSGTAQTSADDGSNDCIHPIPQAASWQYPQPLPEPTRDYILTSSLSPYRLESPTTKLLVLDLNGTLLYRHRRPSKDMRHASQNPFLRPHLAQFMNYIFRHYKIMVWSSATTANVHAMISAATTPSQRAEIIAIWDRSSLGLSPTAYKQKSVTFKDLRKIFNDKALQKDHTQGWDESNTILLDDSVVKASHQPYNHVCLPEYVERASDPTDDALQQVAGYLAELRFQGHVARFIKRNPFRMGDGWNGMCLAAK